MSSAAGASARNEIKTGTERESANRMRFSVGVTVASAGRGGLLLNVLIGVLDLSRLFLGELDKVIKARRATEFIFPGVNDPSATFVCLIFRHRADSVARL